MKRLTKPSTTKSRFLAPQTHLERKERSSLGITERVGAAFVLLTVATCISPSARAHVTPQRLLDSAKDPQNWLMYSGDYAGRRVSALDQINTSNAASLVPKWAYQTMGVGKFETTPLAVDGVLYATGQDDRAFALDARAGPPLCQYHRALPSDINPSSEPLNHAFPI